MKNWLLLMPALLLWSSGCSDFGTPVPALQPDQVTEKTLNDTDDPAIWIHPDDPGQSLIMGTDKGDENGGVYVFDLDGKINRDKSILNLLRPNNIDVAYGLPLSDSVKTDIAVFTERGRDCIRVLSVPDMQFIDGGGIPVFEGETERAPMGVSLYTEPGSGAIYAIVSRKTGPDGSYLWQYLLKADSSGQVAGALVRQFGAFKGGKEIEAIAVDNELGYVYYSDEGAGVRKYHAHPDSSQAELAVFAQTDFKDDHEGISIYKTGEQAGYILVSDQQANRFHVFDRRAPHRRLAIVPMSTSESDGSEVTSVPIGDQYPMGFFVAMSDDKTFQIYRWEAIQACVEAQLQER